MENKNMIRTFCGCKPSMINSDIHKISKSKKVNNLWQKLSEQQNMKFINYVYLREKEAYNNK